GSFFVGMDHAARGDVLWALLVARATSVGLMTGAVIATRPALAVGSRNLGVLAGVGVADVSANALYAVATTKGLLSLVGVLGSLYQLTTIVLARLVLHERIRRVQEIGVAATIAGVALIAAG